MRLVLRSAAAWCDSPPCTTVVGRDEQPHVYMDHKIEPSFVHTNKQNQKIEESSFKQRQKASSFQNLDKRC